MARDSAIDFSVDQAQKLFGKGIEVLGRASGIETLYDYGRGVVEQQEEDIRQGNYQPEYTMGLREAYTQGGIGNALGWLGEKTQENLATSAPALVGGLAAALTAPFSVPVAALIGGSTLVGSSIMGTGEVAQEMEQKTGEYNDAVAIGAGTLIGLLDRFGAGKVIPKDELLTMTGKQLIRALGAEGKIDAAREIGKRIGRATAFEAVTEGTQEGVSVGATALTGGEYTGLEVADKLLEGFVLGGTMGGGMSTGIETFRQGPGAVNKVQDMFSGGPGMGGFTPQMAMAGAQFSPDRAQMELIPEVPLTTSEILMNQGPSNQGSNKKTPEQLEAERIQKINESTEKNLNANTDEQVDPTKNFFNQNMTGESTKDNPTVSPLRIILTNLKKDEEQKKSANTYVQKTGKDIIGDLRAAEKGRPGLVGFMSNPEIETDITYTDKFGPAKGVDGQTFGKAMKEAKGKVENLPLLPDGKPMYQVTGRTPVKQEKAILAFNNDPTGKSDSITQNRGGEAYNSGLEEFLARNKDKDLSYNDVIEAFDQTRPQVKLEVRSKLAGQNPTGLLVNAANPEAGNTLDLSNVAALGSTLEVTQRIKQNFVDENGDQVSDPNDFEVDSIAVISHDEGKSTLRSGVLENSGTIASAKESVRRPGDDDGSQIKGDTDPLVIGSGHDYHRKGAAYIRLMVVRGEDGKLYAVVEEVQDDGSRIKEENLDVATPMYSLEQTNDPDQTLEKTWTNRFSEVKYGKIPKQLLQERFDNFYKDPVEQGQVKPVTLPDKRRPTSLDSFKAQLELDAFGNELPRAGNYRAGKSRNIFDASEKQKVITMDKIELGMPFEDSVVKLRDQRTKLQKDKDLAFDKITEINKKIETLNEEQIANRSLNILPRVNVDLKEMMLEDVVNNQNEFVGAINSLVQDKTAILGRDLNSDLYDLFEKLGADDSIPANVIAPVIEATWFKLAKENKLNIGVKKRPPIFNTASFEIGEVQAGRRNPLGGSKQLGHETRLATEATTALNDYNKSTREILEEMGIENQYSKADPIHLMLDMMPGKINFSVMEFYPTMSENRIRMEPQNEDNRYLLSGKPSTYFKAMQERTNKPEAFRKTINMIMKEIINQQAKNVMEAKFHKHIFQEHILKNKDSENTMPITDLNELIIANYKTERNIGSFSTAPSAEDLASATPSENIQKNRVDLEGLQADVMERLGPKALKDIQKFMEQEVLKISKKIGFMPENDSATSYIYLREANDKGLISTVDIKDMSDSEKIKIYVDSLVNTPENYMSRNKYAPLFDKAFIQAREQNDPNREKRMKETSEALQEDLKNFGAIARKKAEELGGIVNHRKEVRRRVKAFEKAIGERAQEFKYSPKELLDAFQRLQAHLDNDVLYMRDSAHSSQAQASRAIIKGAINQLPTLNNLYKEPIAGIVFPAKTDLQNMSGRAQLPPNDGSARYLKALAKHKKAGLTSYEVAPNLVKKQFQDALLDEKGNSRVKVDEGVEFNMIGKSGAKAKLRNPVQFILNIEPGTDGEKLARSKFVFKAKGGTVDLRKAV